MTSKKRKLEAKESNDKESEKIPAARLNSGIVASGKKTKNRVDVEERALRLDRKAKDQKSKANKDRKEENVDEKEDDGDDNDNNDDDDDDDDDNDDDDDDDDCD